MPTLYLIRGVPGSGKSSLAHNMRVAGMIHQYFEADDYFINHGQYSFDPKKLHEAHLRCQSRVRTYLEAGFDVAVSNTSTTEKEVKVYEDIAKEYNAKFVSIIVENRHGGVNVHNVPDDKIQQMKDRFSVKL